MRDNLESCDIGYNLVLCINRKSYTGFRFVPKSVTLNDSGRRIDADARNLCSS